MLVYKCTHRGSASRLTPAAARRSAHAVFCSGECGAAASCSPATPSWSRWQHEATAQKGSVSAGVAAEAAMAVLAPAKSTAVVAAPAGGEWRLLNFGPA